MKKVLTSIAAFGLIGIAAPAAHAVDGTINFTGTLVQQTCEVQTGEDLQSINLQSLPVGLFNAVQGTKTSDAKGFSIHVKNCSADPGSITAIFESTGAVDADGRLVNTATSGAAQNVWLEVLDNADNGNPALIKVNDDASQKLNSTYATVDTNGLATLNYAVRYYSNSAIGPVTPGDVAATVTYTFAYK